jgi:hypothetical protein
MRARLVELMGVAEERGGLRRAPWRGWGPAQLIEERGGLCRAPSRGWGPAPLIEVPQ